MDVTFLVPDHLSPGSRVRELRRKVSSGPRLQSADISPLTRTLTMGDQPEIWKAVAMADHFDKMQKLKDPVAGVPNFRRVPGYKVKWRNRSEHGNI